MSSVALISRIYATAAARLRLQKGRDVPEFVRVRRSVDPPKRAAYVQTPFVL
jgi:hypothetical protein